TAILLLVNADKRLKSLADPSVLPVRANLAEDIQTLQQLNPVS
ncbi:MAG TPA: heme biosynthesis operon protein HemX, partial [Alteromonas macleodii]|nr:heme biosynthesis operon protein HemX [Alteromonas macleodii]